MITLTLVSLLLAVLFTGTATWVRRELPESISSLVYLLPPVGRWVWTVWLWTVAMTACMPLISVMPENVEFLGFLTLCCLLFCGAMPLFMEDKQKVHNALGIAAGVLSQVCVLLTCPAWLFTWTLFVFCMGAEYVQPDGWLAKAVDKKEVFIAEAICAVNVWGACLVFL